jgi:hypothetical protein
MNAQERPFNFSATTDSISRIMLAGNIGYCMELNKLKP